MRSAAGRARLLTQRVVTIAALLAGAALTFGLLAQREDEGLANGATEESRGYYLSDARLIELGPDGRARVIVRARSIEQQVADESVRLDDLELDYTTTRDGAWRVTAERGRMPSDRASLQLAGNVQVSGSPEATGARVTIVTDELEYDTGANIVQTASPVSIQFGTHALQGRGLRVALNDGRLRLESNVHGTFTP